MAYDAQVLRRASARLKQQNAQRQQQREELRERLFTETPELRDIDRQLKGTILDIVGSALRTGRDPGPALQVIRDKNMDLQQRQAQLLQEMGYPADALDELPACPKCGDTGWVGAQMCDCLEIVYAQEQVKELSKLLNVGEQSFDQFSLDWYSPLPWPGESISPRENMELVYEVCLNYAQKFGKFFFQNLFLTGDPGLGKTFLSACIARTVAENGFSVVYDTASTILTQFEEGKFARDTEEGRQAREETNRYLHCDLLILDDLGSEARTPFFQSALYTLVNTRLVEGRAKVITSNLSMEGIRNRYSGQVASRLEGEYQTLRFYGEDIRLQRKQRG